MVGAPEMTYCGTRYAPGHFLVLSDATNSGEANMMDGSLPRPLFLLLATSSHCFGHRSTGHCMQTPTSITLIELLKKQSCRCSPPLDTLIIRPMTKLRSEMALYLYPYQWNSWAALLSHAVTPCYRTLGRLQMGCRQDPGSPNDLHCRSRSRSFDKPSHRVVAVCRGRQPATSGWLADVWDDGAVLVDLVPCAVCGMSVQSWDGQRYQ